MWIWRVACVVVLGLLGWGEIAHGELTFRVADRPLTPDEVAAQVKPGEILLDPRMVEKFPDIQSVIQKLEGTLNGKAWPKFEGPAGVARQTLGDGGIYVEYAPENVPLDKLIKPNGRLSGTTTAGDAPPGSTNRVQLTPLAGVTDYGLAQTIVHELVHLGKNKNCPWSETLGTMAKGAVGGFVTGAVLGARGGLKGVAIAGGGLGLAGAFGGWVMACKDEADPEGVENNMPKDLFDGRVRPDYPVSRTLRDGHGLSEQQVRDIFEKNPAGFGVPCAGATGNTTQTSGGSQKRVGSGPCHQAGFGGGVTSTPSCCGAKTGLYAEVDLPLLHFGDELSLLAHASAKLLFVDGFDAGLQLAGEGSWRPQVALFGVQPRLAAGLALEMDNNGGLALNPFFTAGARLLAAEFGALDVALTLTGQAMRVETGVHYNF